MVFGIDLQTFRLGLVVPCAMLGIMVLPVSPARADLRVCNETANQVSIALGYRAERGWQSEGWWIAPPSRCATVYQGALNSRFFYIFAADDIGGGAWDGSVFMCSRDQTFTIFGVEDCLARGYERTGFFEIDTQNRSEWMLQLTDADTVPREAGTDAPPDQVMLLGGDEMVPGDEIDDTIPLDGIDPDAPQEGVTKQ